MDSIFMYMSAITRKYNVAFNIDISEDGRIFIRLAAMRANNSYLVTRLISSEDAKSDSIDKVVRWNVNKMLKEIQNQEKEDTDNEEVK